MEIMTPPSTILRIHHDALFAILEELSHHDWSLRMLSTTCTYLRRASMPILFRKCTSTLYVPAEPHALPPHSLWPYIRSMRFTDQCSYAQEVRSTMIRSLEDYDNREKYYLEDIMLCEVFSPFLFDALRRMPLLDTLTIDYACTDIHGLSSATIEAVLSIPQLRHLWISGLLLCPQGVDDSLSNPRDPRWAPLSTFTLLFPGIPPRWRPSQCAALAAILGQLGDSLESLDLPAETYPFDHIPVSRLTRLRTLVLDSELSPTTRLDAVYDMPSLRSLTLYLRTPTDSSPVSVYSAGNDALSAWRNLESLTLGHPQPDDPVFRHLPQTLRHLRLCIEPYYYKYCRWGPHMLRGGEWTFPLPTTSELLRMLSQQTIPSLTSLVLECHADDAEIDFFRVIPRSYPNLTSLTVHIYRPDGTKHDTVPVADIAHALSPLSRLLTVRLYLGFAPVQRSFGVGGFIPQDESAPNVVPVDPEHALLEAAVNKAARTLADALAPSLHTIYLLQPSEGKSEWMKFCVVRACTGRNAEDLQISSGAFALEYAHGALYGMPENVLFMY